MQSCRKAVTEGLVKNGLLTGRGLIGESWVPAISGRSFAVLDPVTGTEIQHVAEMGAEDAVLAVDAATKSFASWKARTTQERARILKKWSDEIAKNSNDLAGLMCMENGKPRAESKGEVNYARSYIDFYAGMQPNGAVIQPRNNRQMLLVTKEPVGVCSLLTPWNFPAAMFTRKAAPALLAGCTVIHKPAEDTPLTSLALAKLWRKAGGPPGVVNVVPTSRDLVPEVGLVLTSHEGVRKVSFTGSTAVGKQLMRQAAGTVKKTSMELGGNAPFVVLDDADLDAAVDGAMAAKFRFGGQVCIAPNRFMVQECVHDEFVEKMAARTRALKVGDGFSPSTNLGPLINPSAKEKVWGLVRDALDKGAEAVVGGHCDHEMGPNFFPPTLLSRCTLDMRVSQEEIFGPVVAVMKFSHDDDALSLSNRSRSGLSGYVYTKDYRRGLKFAHGLEVGMVGFNETALSGAAIPFGGVKESGIGREGSTLGLEDYLVAKHICLGGL